MIKVGILAKYETEIQKIKAVLEREYQLYPECPMPKMQVVFETDHLKSLFKPPIEEQPDVLLVDLKSRNTRGLEMIRKTWPKTEIIINDESEDVTVVRQFLRNGAVGYLLKKDLHFFLPMAVAIIHHGGSFISPSVSRKLIEHISGVQQNLNVLTARELQIAEGLLEGFSYKMIADKHEISLDTVRVYVKRIYRKFNINSKGELQAQFIYQKPVS